MSKGIPWDETMSPVPRMVHFPRLVAKITIGAIVLSRALNVAKKTRLVFKLLVAE